MLNDLVHECGLWGMIIPALAIPAIACGAAACVAGWRGSRASTRIAIAAAACALCSLLLVVGFVGSVAGFVQMQAILENLNGVEAERLLASGPRVAWAPMRLALFGVIPGYLLAGLGYSGKLSSPWRRTESGHPIAVSLRAADVPTGPWDIDSLS